MKIKLRALFFILLITVLMFHEKNIFVLFLAAAIHELGHLLVAKILKIRLNELNIGIFGAGLSCDTSAISYSYEIFLCLGGPLINFLCATVCVLFFREHLFYNDFLKNFVISSLSLGTLNILPIKSFDGGRIFYAFVSKMFSTKVADNSQSVISFALIFTMWSFSIFLLLKYSFSLSLFVFSLSLFVKIFISLWLVNW